MTALHAFTRSTSDEELGALVVELGARWAGPPSSPARVWCFVEGATRSGFLEPATVGADLTGEIWLVRLFGSSGELAARRTGFDTERPWLTRVIAMQLQGNEWMKHELGARREISLALYGEDQADGRFRDPFAYPLFDGRSSGSIWLILEEHAFGEGASIVRWMRLEGY